MSRQSKIVDQMYLLGIEDVSTPRQCKNGTVVWRLPIKNKWKSGSFIEVASFTTGYVRNQNSGYSNYQLNKRCQSEPQYYPEYKWCDKKGKSSPTGKYNMYKTRACVLIPKEVDRLEYLIAYCLKNYYIKHANFVAEGVYVSKWEHEYKLTEEVKRYDNAINGIDCGHYDRIKELEDRIYELESQVDVADNKLSNAISPTKYECAKQHYIILQNKLATIERIANDTNKWNG